MQIETSIFPPSRSLESEKARVRFSFEFIFSSICSELWPACCLSRGPRSVNKGAFVALCWLIVYFLRQFLLLTTTRAIYLWKMIFMAGVFVFKRLFHNSEPALVWRGRKFAVILNWLLRLETIMRIDLSVVCRRSARVKCENKMPARRHFLTAFSRSTRSNQKESQFMSINFRENCPQITLGIFRARSK